MTFCISNIFYINEYCSIEVRHCLLVLCLLPYTVYGACSPEENKKMQTEYTECTSKFFFSLSWFRIKRSYIFLCRFSKLFILKKFLCWPSPIWKDILFTFSWTIKKYYAFIFMFVSNYRKRIAFCDMLEKSLQYEMYLLFYEL